MIASASWRSASDAADTEHGDVGRGRQRGLIVSVAASMKIAKREVGRG